MNFEHKKRPKTSPGPKTVFLGHLKVQKVQKVFLFDNVRNAAMYAIVFYFFFKKVPYVTFDGPVRFACFS